MAASRKANTGKKVMMMRAMAKDAAAQSRGVANTKAPKSVGKKKAPSHPKGVKALAAKSRVKQTQKIPDPSALLTMIPKPSAAPRKPRKK